MDDVNARIERVTEDLRMIQQELNLAAVQSPEDVAEDPGLVSADALETLKSALDQMRHFLFFYCQIVSGESDLRDRLRQALKQRTEEQESGSAGIDRLASAANRAFFRYRLNGKKPN